MKFAFLALLLPALLFAAACQTTRTFAPARDVDVRVFDGDRAEGFKEIWVVDKATGERLEPLLEGASIRYNARFSPSKAWLAIEDVMFDNLTTVRLFHHETAGGFRRIPDENFILAAWNHFLEEQGAPGEAPVASSSTLARWDEAGNAIILRLTATLADGRRLSGNVRIDLSSLE